MSSHTQLPGDQTISRSHLYHHLAFLRQGFHFKEMRESVYLKITLRLGVEAQVT